MIVRGVALALAGCGSAGQEFTSVAPPTSEDTGAPAAIVADSGDTAATGDTGSSGLVSTCEPIGAVFFDLGETLAQEDADGVLQTRPGAVDGVNALVAAGVRVGVISNTYEGWGEQDLAALLAEPELLDLFEVVLTSGMADADPKPDPAIYAEAHAMLVGHLPSGEAGPPIERTAFVTEEIGDLADREVAPTEGARAAGMFGVLLSYNVSAWADAQLAPDAMATIATAPWMICP